MARWRRRILWIALGLLGLVVLCIGLALIAAANLDARPMKGIVVGLAKDQGVALDYDVAGVTFGGVKVRNLRVASPAEDAALAPDLIKIGRIDGRWSLFSKRVDELVVGELALTVVVDPDGTTSLDRFLAGIPPSEPKPETPLSRVLELVRIEGVTAHARVEAVTVTVLRKGQDPITLTGLEATAALENGLLHAGLGPSELRLQIGKQHAAVRLGIAVETTQDTAKLTIDGSLVSQDLDPKLPPVKKIIDLAATATFVPAEQRTGVVLEKLHLLDGAVRVEAQAELYDSKGPLLRTLTAFVDLAAVARATPAQFGPIEVAGEPLRISAEGVEVTPVLKGKLSAAGKLERLRYQDIEVAGLALDATASPDGDGFHAALKLPVERLKMPDLEVNGVSVELTASRAPGAVPVKLDATLGAAGVKQPGLAVTDARVVVDGTWKGGTALDAKLTVQLVKLTGPAEVERLQLDTTLKDVVIADPPLRSTGAIDLQGRIMEVRLPGTGNVHGVILAGAWKLGSPISGHLEIGAARTFMPSLAKTVPDLGGAPLGVRIDAPEIVLDEADLMKSRAKLGVKGELGSTRFELAAQGTAADLDYELTASTERAGPARGVKLASKGHYGNEIRQESTIDVASVSQSGARVSGARVALSSKGTLEQQKADIALTAAGVNVNGKALGQARLDVGADVDLRRPSLDMTLRGRKPDADLKIGAAVEGGALRWQMDGKLAKLGALSGFLPEGPDWERVAIDVDGKGTATGVVKRGPGGAIVLAPDPARSARGKQSLRLAVRDLHYRGPNEASADVDKLTLVADVTLGGGDNLVAKVDLAIPALSAVQSGVHLNLDDLKVKLDATQGRRKLSADLTIEAREIKQSALPSYPVRELSLRAKASGDPEGALSLEAKLTNGGAATEFSAKGELERRADRAEDAVAARHALVLEGKLEQQLDRLDGAPNELRGRGKISIPFRVESGDLTLFRTSARITLSDVWLELPPQKLTVTNVRGELPIVQEIVLGANGVERVGSGANGVYQRLRFSDHRPYLGDADYLALDSHEWDKHKIGPLAGNIRVDRDIVAVDQLEMSALGGKIAGQVLIGLADKDTRIDFRGKLTGIRPTKGDDRLDANAALSLIPYRQGMEGRVEIVRISKRHLKDLLDLYDPYHADVAANRVRMGLIAGYPKRVRLFFQSGFARMEVELGGLVGGVRIDPIEGIPIGPALSTWLAPVLEATPK